MSSLIWTEVVSYLHPFASGVDAFHRQTLARAINFHAEFAGNDRSSGAGMASNIFFTNSP